MCRSKYKVGRERDFFFFFRFNDNLPSYEYWIEQERKFSEGRGVGNGKGNVRGRELEEEGLVSGEPVNKAGYRPRTHPRASGDKILGFTIDSFSSYVCIISRIYRQL